MLKYAKALVAAAGAAIFSLSEAGVFADKAWFQTLVAWATVLGVYSVRNAD